VCGRRLTIRFPTDYLLVVLPLSLLRLFPHVTLLSRSFLLHSSSGSFDACDPGACIGRSALRPAVSLFGVVQAAPSLAPVCAIRAFADRGRIDVHRVRIPSGLLTRWSSKRFAASILARAEEVTASRSEAGPHHASTFDFASRGCLPVIKALWYRISLDDGVMDSLSKSLPKHLQGSFCTAFPNSANDEVLEGSDPFVYIVAFHFEFHQVIV